MGVEWDMEGTEIAVNLGRNDPCPCGSGKKYKKCHLLIEQAEDKIKNEALEKWFEEDLKEGQKNLEEYESKVGKHE